MNTPSEAVDDMTVREADFDFEALFHSEYERITRVIAGIVRDHARAEELAVEVFRKLLRNREAQGDRCRGWLHRTAVRAGLNELRREARRAKYERLFSFARKVLNPEEAYTATEEQRRVRTVLAAIDTRHAELLLLRNEGLSYGELASTLQMNPASVGTYLSRARQAFRKEYCKRHGEQ